MKKIQGNDPIRTENGVIRLNSVRERYAAEIVEKNRLLLETQQRQKALLDSIPDIVWLKDQESRFIAVNQPFGTACGRNPEELVGKTDLDIWPRELAERYRADDRRVMESGRMKRVEEPLVEPDGRKTWIETIKVPIRDDLGRIVGTVGIARDITERRRMEEELRGSRDDLECRVEERTAELMAANASLREIESELRKGLRRERALRRINDGILSGANYRDVLEIACDAIMEMGYRMCWVGLVEDDFTVRPVVSRGLEAGYLEKIRVRWDDTPEGRGPTGISVRTGKPYLCRDIQEDPIFAPWRDEARNRGYRSSATFPLRSGESEAIGVLHVYRETEWNFSTGEIHDVETFAQQCTVALLHARRLEELRDAHQRLSFHVQRMPLAYIVWGTDYRVAEWNPSAEKIFGWSAREAVGKHANDLVVPLEAREHVDGIWTKLMEGNQSSHSVNANVRKDGAKLVCEWFNTPLRGPSGEIAGVLSMVHDVTEKHTLEKQLQMAQKMEAVGTLAGGIAHDFNNALTGILGFSELARLRVAGNERVLSDLGEITRCAERASGLTKQLLAFARRQVIDPVNLTLNTVVSGLMKFVSKVAGERIEVALILAEGLPTIRADLGQMEQVIMNLCLNARDAMPGGGRLLLETGEATIDEGYGAQAPYMKAGRFAVLKISDTGVGMDEKTRERVFEPFFTTKGPDQGTGLGLAVVYGIVKQHDGFIQVSSEPGKGTAFRLYFPAVEGTPDPVQEKKADPIRGGTETILLAEDETTVRNLAARTLSKMGYTVLEAQDGVEAVEIFRKRGEEISLAVLDVVMPRKSGKEALEEMRKSSPGLKAVFTSGYSADAVHHSFVLDLSVPFLPKPYGPAALARKVREILDSVIGAAPEPPGKQV